MRFSIVWTLPIPTLVTAYAGANSLENHKNDSLSAPPPSTEERHGNFQEILAKIHIPPAEENIPLNKQVFARAKYTEDAMKVHSNVENDLIIQGLWKEFENDNPALNLAESHPPYIVELIESTFKLFIKQDPDRERRYAKWREWRMTNFGENNPDFTLAMVKAPNKEWASVIMQKFWKDFRELPTKKWIAATKQAFANAEPTEYATMHSNVENGLTIQKLWEEFEREFPILNPAEKYQSSTEEMIESTFKLFINQDPERQRRYAKWRKWQTTSFGENHPDFTLAMVKAPNGEEASVIMQTLWKDFIRLEKIPTEMSTLDQLDPAFQDYFTADFLVFVLQDPKRSEEWIRLLKFKAGTGEALIPEEVPASVARETTGWKTGHTAMAPKKSTSSSHKKATPELIRKLLWSKFQQKWKNKYPEILRVSTFDQLDSTSQGKLEATFLSFVKNNPRRRMLFEDLGRKTRQASRGHPVKSTVRNSPS